MRIIFILSGIISIFVLVPNPVFAWECKKVKSNTDAFLEIKIQCRENVGEPYYTYGTVSLYDRDGNLIDIYETRIIPNPNYNFNKNSQTPKYRSIPHGTHKRFDSQGNVIERSIYDENGNAVRIYENEKLVRENIYKTSNGNTLTRYEYRNGKLIGEYEFKDNVLINEIKY